MHVTWLCFLCAFLLNTVRSNECVFNDLDIPIDCHYLAREISSKYSNGLKDVCNYIATRLSLSLQTKDKCKWNGADHYNKCEGEVSMKLTADEGVLDWDRLCDLGSASRNECLDLKIRPEYGERREHYCKWIVPQWQQQRYKYLKKIIGQLMMNHVQIYKNLNIMEAFEKWTGFDTGNHGYQEIPLFVDKKLTQKEITDKVNKYKEAHSIGTLKDGELKTDVKDTTKEVEDINSRLKHYTVYDLTTRVKTADNTKIDGKGWKTIGLLKNEEQSCTATMIDKNWLLSAAHCVIDKDKGYQKMGKYIEARIPFEGKLKFFAGMNGGSNIPETGKGIDVIETNGKYDKVYEIEEVYVPIGYVLLVHQLNIDADQYDYCLLKIKSVSVGTIDTFSIGYFEGDNIWKSGSFNTAGYPSKANSIYMYYSPLSFKWDDVPAIKEKKEIIFGKKPIHDRYAIDAGRKVYTGQSGSSIWTYHQTLNIIMGIVSRSGAMNYDEIDKKIVKHQKRIEAIFDDLKKMHKKIKFFEETLKIKPSAKLKETGQSMGDALVEWTKYRDKYEEPLKVEVKLREQHVEDLKKLKVHDNGIDFGVEAIRITPQRFWRIVAISKLKVQTKFKVDKSKMVSLANEEYIDNMDNMDNEYTVYTAYNNNIFIMYMFVFIFIVWCMYIVGGISCAFGLVFGWISVDKFENIEEENV